MLTCFQIFNPENSPLEVKLGYSLLLCLNVNHNTGQIKLSNTHASTLLSLYPQI